MNTPNNGDELAIYDSQSNIVGSGVYNGSNFTIPVWENDASSSIKIGMNNNEQFTLSYWNSQTNVVSPLTVTWSLGDNTYSRDGLSITSSIAEANKSARNEFIILSNLKIAPNPASDRFYITLNTKTDCNVQVSIVDNVGCFVHTQESEVVLGFNKITVPCNNLAPGSYRVIVTNSNEKLIKKLIIL
ncbi:MAG: T9SS type A sorting domain-containing protein [Bacteroidales bacterium]|nr:T9SS type A sorting domain-containing protein [Bacteroidales bacterium]MCF8457803.1 T9SS type A sorting domain-containing protein [Bacteroidales bacterium]